tara:strand:- start:1567 stop:2433 length:867 start_codon:yes stop_codon:yes gene_type:complete
MSDIAYLNGEFMKLAEATVSVEDRGFQFGDGVYEVIRVYDMTPHLLREHIDRLKFSATSIHLDEWLSYDEWEKIVQEGISQSGYAEAKVYIQLTRGVAPRDHRFPCTTSLTRVMTVREVEPDDLQLRKTGVSVITAQDIRWNRCDIKSLNLLPNILAKQQAIQAGMFEALFVREGFVFEGSSSTVMVVSNGVLYTPAEGPRILSGITRDWVLSVARASEIKVVEEPVSVEMMLDAQEVLLTGTIIEIMPVVKVDEYCIGDGKPGKIYHRLYQKFLSSISELRYRHVCT